MIREEIWRIVCVKNVWLYYGGCVYMFIDSCFLIILFNVIEFFMLMICLFIVKSGLFEGELEDILVCDDDVFNDVYIYWILFLC